MRTSLRLLKIGEQLIGLTRHLGPIVCFVVIAMLTVFPLAYADDELPFKATTIIIELTDNDIELQVFVDGNEWKHLEIADPSERRIFKLKTKKSLGKQGMSEMHFASQPSPFPEDAPSAAATETVEAFLARFPAGDYEVEGVTLDGSELEGIATLTHVLPALPEIVAPIADGDDPPIVDLSDDTVIEWELVTTRFIGSGPVEIVGYQVIVEQVEPFQMLTINLPASATSVTVPPEFLMPDKLYDFEVLAIEASGNQTISTGEFMTEE